MTASESAPLSRRWLIPAVLMLASAVGILATDLYAPSLPRLTEVFATRAETVQLTMTLNMLGFACGQLLFGPLSDRFGRRPAMLFGLSMFVAFSLACGLAWSIESLIAFRIAQGIVAACEAVIGMAVIKELYGEAAGVKIIAIYSMVIASAPAVGPIVGGQMLVLFGWQSNFWLLAGLAALSLVLCLRFLTETSRPDRSALRPSRLLVETRAALGVPAFWFYTIGPAAGIGCFFAYVTEGPFVLIDQLGVPAEEFGFYQAIIVAMFFSASIVVNRLASRLAPRTILRIGSCAALSAATAGLAFVLADQVTKWSVVFTMSLVGVSVAFVYAVGPLHALASTKAATGMASSWRGFIEMTGAMLGSAGVALLHDGTPWPLFLVIACCAVVITIGDIGTRACTRAAAATPA